jgi:hypothetical protein
MVSNGKPKANTRRRQRPLIMRVGAVCSSPQGFRGSDFGDADEVDADCSKKCKKNGGGMETSHAEGLNLGAALSKDHNRCLETVQGKIKPNAVQIMPLKRSVTEVCFDHLEDFVVADFVVAEFCGCEFCGGGFRGCGKCSCGIRGCGILWLQISWLRKMWLRIS